MKTLYIVTVLCICALLSSCMAPPKAKVTCILDLKITPTSEGITVVFDVGRYLGPKFRTAFEKKFLEISPPSRKQLEIMPYIEFIRSPYNKPDVNDSFSNRLFVFITRRGTSSYGYNVTDIDYLLEVKYLNKDPFLAQEINLYCGDLFRCTSEKHVVELARAILEELKNRKIL